MYELFTDENQATQETLYLIGWKVHYTCDAGYDSVIPSVRTCHGNSDEHAYWNGSNPICEGSIRFINVSNNLIYICLICVFSNNIDC